MEAMRKRRELLVCILIGTSFMLVASLVAAIAPRSKMATAQSETRISISIGESTLPQGGASYLVGQFFNLPQDPNDDGEFHPDHSFRFDLERNSEGTWSDANDCEESPIGENKRFITWYRSPIDFRTVFPGGFQIPSNCPVGSYRVLATARLSSSPTDVVTQTHELTVIPGPQVTIDITSTPPFYRGAQIDVTMKFNHLNNLLDDNLPDDKSLSYRADIMEIVSEDSFNYANECEGTGIGNVDKSTDATNSFNRSPSGAIDDQDNDGTVEVSGQIATTCPTGTFKLEVRLWDSSNSELTSKTVEYVISTDANASPTARMELSESTVQPGNTIDVTATFYDIQGDSNTRVYTEAYVYQIVNGAQQTVSDCHGPGMGYDVQTAVYRNPIVQTYTIADTCPTGSYTVKVHYLDSSNQEIISVSKVFTIGNPPPPPDLLPTFDTTWNPTYTARERIQFTQQLIEGSGGDGTLTYEAEDLPPGLEFIASTRTVQGTPTQDGNYVVTYKVEDADGDPASTTFRINVADNPVPTPPIVSNYTAQVGTLFEEQLPEGSGGDGTLAYDATGLPDGLVFIAATRTIRARRQQRGRRPSRTQ